MKNTHTTNIESLVSMRVKEILKLQDGISLDPDSDLFGSLDSLSVMDLVVSLENDFEIQIKPEDMTAEKFSSIKNISNFIKEELSEH